MLVFGFAVFGLFSLYGVVVSMAASERREAMAQCRAFAEAYGHRRCDYDRGQQMAARYFETHPDATEVDLGGPGAFGSWTDYPRLARKLAKQKVQA